MTPWPPSGPTARRPSSWGDRWRRNLRTSCSSIRRATTSAPPRSGRSCRSGRASTASSCWSWRPRPRSDIDTATSIALGSMMSTARANLSVGPPYDGCIAINDTFKPVQFRIESDSPLLEELREAWERQMLECHDRDPEDLVGRSDHRPRRSRGRRRPDQRITRGRLGREDVESQLLGDVPRDQLAPDAVAGAVQAGARRCPVPPFPARWSRCRR